MEVSSQDPAVMAMDLSKGYSVKPLTRSHTASMNLAKKPEWYHRRPVSCGAAIASPYRTRASSSYSLRTEASAPVHCRDFEQSPEALGNYVDLYHDGVHSNLWHPGFYGPDESCGPGPESSGGEESDSGSDVIVLVSSAKEPLLCSSFIQDSVRHIVEPLSPAVSSLDEGTGCYHLPQPLSSPSPDSSYSEDSSDSSVDIPVHHTRPVVLLSDLSAVYGNRTDSPVDISSDDSDVIEVSVTNEKKKSHAFRRRKSVPCKKKVQEPTPPSESERAPPGRVRRSNRIKRSSPETPPYTCSASRLSLRRQAKKDAVGIYNESWFSDDMLEYAGRLSSSDESVSQPNLAHGACSPSEESEAETRMAGKSPPKLQQVDSEPEPEPEPRDKSPPAKSIDHKRKKPLSICKSKRVRQSRPKPDHRGPPEQDQGAAASRGMRGVRAGKKPTTRRRRRRHTKTGPSALFFEEPEIKLKFTSLRKGRTAQRSEGFCPFVHMEQRVCTVVNYQEDEATVRSSSTRRPPTAAAATASLPGFVPNTSCFHLGRLSSESKCPATLLCCLCGQVANVMGLGDLHGPYYPVGRSADHHSPQQRDKENVHGLDNSVHAPGGGGSGGEEDKSLPEAPPDPDECWIHEDCGIWSAGVFLVRGKLYGLAEAAQLAQETTCSTCQQTGAIMGCFQKGCSRNYHYRCAVQSGCVLIDENFSMKCPEHKNIALKSGPRPHKR